MGLTTPDKIRSLQRKLYRRAKAEPDFRFYALLWPMPTCPPYDFGRRDGWQYDKVYRRDIIEHAYRLAKANGGAPGVDGVTFAMIEAKGAGEWLTGLREDLWRKTYQAQPVRRVTIPKPGGGERPLGIPTIRDRVAQTAAKLVLEPIFEADLDPNVHCQPSRLPKSYGGQVGMGQNGRRSGTT